MKTLVFIVVYLSIGLSVSAQVSKDQFKKYQDCFPVYPYPFRIAPDYEKSTRINTYAKALPKDLLQKFVYDQGMKPHAWACGKDWVHDYKYYIQFPSINNFSLLVITGDITPPCGEATYMLSYDNSGNLTDTLLISAQGYLSLPTEDNRSGESFTVESIITGDSIYVERKEELGKLIIIDRYKRKYRRLTYNYTYKLNSEGKFIRIREGQIRDEEIEYELKK